MKSRNFSSQAIILSRKNYSEADRIITAFSRDFGKLTFLAKGVRGVKSRKRGHLEIFNLLNFSASRGRDMNLMTEAEVVNNFSLIRKSLKKTAVAYFLVDVVKRVTRDEEEHREVFDLLSEYLQKLETTTAMKSLRNDFSYKLLVLLGFWPSGKILTDTDRVLEEIVEHELSSIRVGKKIAG